MNELSELKAALEAIDLRFVNDAWYLDINGTNPGEMSFQFDLAAGVLSSVLEKWKIVKDKALGIWRPEVEEGYELKTAEEMLGEILLEGSKIWIEPGAKWWVAANCPREMTVEGIDITKFFAVPIPSKEPPTFLKVMEAGCVDFHDRPRTMFEIICRRAGEGANPKIQMKQGVSKRWIWVDIKIGVTLNYLEAETVSLNKFRFTPEEENESD